MPYQPSPYLLPVEVRAWQQWNRSQQRGQGQRPVQTQPATDPLWDQVQADQDRANAANEARYQQLLGLSDTGKAEEVGAWQAGYGDLMGLAGQGAEASKMREQQSLKQNLGAAQADATARGLGNTTILSSLRRGAQDESAMRMQGIDDSLNRNKLAVGQNYYARLLDAIQQANNRKMGVIERRTDEGPDLGLYASLLSRPGATGGGYTLPPQLFLGGGGGGGASNPQTFGGGFVRPNAPDGVVNQWPSSSRQQQIKRPQPRTGRVQGVNFPYQV